jgi:hypothetical protein
MKPIPKDKKILRFGHCYVNPDGSFAIGLVEGTKRRGYWFLATHADPNVICLNKIMVLSRVVPNDGHWTEISPDMFCDFKFSRIGI